MSLDIFFFFNVSPVRVRTCLSISSLLIYFFFCGLPVTVRTCLLFSSSSIFSVSFSGSPVPKGISFEGIFFPTVIVVLWFSNHTVFTGGSFGVCGYESSLVMILDQICTGHRYFLICHWVTFSFLSSFLYVLNVGETLSLGWI